VINALKLSAEIIHVAIEGFNRRNAALTRKLTNFVNCWPVAGT
jgi:hypothetical protein